MTVVGSAPGAVDAHAFAAVVAEHAGSLWQMAYSRLGDRHEAEDAVQEALLRAWRSLDGWRGDAALRTWLHTICRNVCIDRLRARRATVSLDVLRDGGFEPPSHGADRAGLEHSALRAALVGLSEDERDAFVLVDALGFSGEEAARICDVPATTLRSRLARAHQKLVAAMQEAEQ